MSKSISESTPCLSIIIPFYNLADCLERCIDSIVRQSFFDFEVIIVDDGSKKEDGLVCDRIAEQDARIKVIHKANGGVSSARTVGVNVSKGDFITFVDADDFVEDRDTYSLIMNRFILDPDIDVVQYPFVSYKYGVTGVSKKWRSPKDERLLSTSEEKINECGAANRWLHGDLTTSLWDKVFRRKIITAISFKEMFLEDVVAVIDMIPITNKILIQKRGLYAYCIRENSSMTSKWGKRKCVQEAEAIIHTYSFLRENSHNLICQNITYFWIVSMLTNISKDFGDNPIFENISTIKTPEKIMESGYNKFRYLLIKCFGLKNYIRLASFVGKMIS